MGLDYIRLVLCWLVLLAVMFTGGKEFGKSEGALCYKTKQKSLEGS